MGAEEQGIATQQLPIAQHLDLGASRRVLTVNQVLQIVLEHQELRDWRQVLDKCIPGRKKFIEAAPAASADVQTTQSTAGSAVHRPADTQTPEASASSDP